MHSEGFPFIVWGSGGWTLVRLPWLVAVALSSRRRRVVNSVSMGEAAKPLLFERFHAGCHVVLRGRRCTLWHSNLFDNVSKVSKLEEVSHEMLVWRRRVYGGSCKTSPFRRFPSRLSCRFAWQAWCKALPSTTLYCKACTKYFPVLLCTTQLAQSRSSTTLYYTACTKHFPAILCTTKLAQNFPVLLCTTKLAQSRSQYYVVLHSLHKVAPVLLCTTKLAQSRSQYYFVLHSLHKAAPVLLCTTQLAQSTSQHYCVLHSLHKALPSTTLYYTACTKSLPVLLCTTKLAQSRSQYYCVLQSLHKVVPSTTLYYTACTKPFPVLLCTTQLAQSTSQHYCVLHSLHKALPSTTLYYTACTKYFPVLLCTTKLAESTSQYYFVLQSLQKALPSTTLYYKACRKHFPVLLCTTKFAQSLHYCVDQAPSLRRYARTMHEKKVCFPIAEVFTRSPRTWIHSGSWLPSCFAMNEGIFSEACLSKLLSESIWTSQKTMNLTQQGKIVENNTVLWITFCSIPWPAWVPLLLGSGLLSAGCSFWSQVIEFSWLAIRSPVCISNL